MSTHLQKSFLPFLQSRLRQNRYRLRLLPTLLVFSIVSIVFILLHGVRIELQQFAVVFLEVLVELRVFFGEFR